MKIGNLDFTLIDQNGKPVDLSAFDANRMVNAIDIVPPASIARDMAAVAGMKDLVWVDDKHSPFKDGDEVYICSPTLGLDGTYEVRHHVTQDDRTESQQPKEREYGMSQATLDRTTRYGDSNIKDATTPGNYSYDDTRKLQDPRLSSEVQPNTLIPCEPGVQRVINVAVEEAQRRAKNYPPSPLGKITARDFAYGLMTELEENPDGALAAILWEYTERRETSEVNGRRRALKMTELPYKG